MAFNIEEFRSIAAINHGFQKLNKYHVRFPIPLGLQTDFEGRNSGQSALDTVRYLEFFCNSADLPGLGLATRKIPRYGYGAEEKKPFAPMYNDVTLTFYNDANNTNLQFFHDWLRLIIRNDFGDSINSEVPLNGAPSVPWEIAYIGEYAVDGQIRLHDSHGNPVYEMVMREMFPIAIPETKMVWEPVPQIMAITVMFTFYDWRIKRDAFDTNNHEPSIVQPPVKVLG